MNQVITTPTNINNDQSIISNKINPLKRKRIMKTVQFAVEVTVLETYSSDEYDRSDIFSTPILYKVNPNIIRSSPQLSLDIESCPPNLIKDEEEGLGEISSAEVSPNTPPSNITTTADEYFITNTSPKKKKKQRPILSVNTTMCADPLFFTSLSTNYKNEINTPDTNSDFLVPISSITL